MQKLIILSDLWGRRNSNWVNNYLEIFRDHFEIIYYDCCELAEIDLSAYTEDQLHHQFTHGGIERAVQRILHQEKTNSHLLGFSIGGVIAWKAILEGLQAKSLTTISSTRLRYENQRPGCTLHVFFAENDAYQPSDNWFLPFNLEKNVYPGVNHDFYMQKEIAIDLSNQIINKLKPSF